jgi:hypothetical protein
MEKKAAMFAVLIAFLANSSWSQDRRLSYADRSEIANQILQDKDQDLIDEAATDSRLLDTVYLSSIHLPKSFVPVVIQKKVVILAPEEIRKRTKTGFLYLQFGQFRLRNGRVRVRFGHYFLNANGGAEYSTGLVYEFRKIRGR